MTVNQKKDALSNALRNYKFADKYFIQLADARMGHKFAIGSRTEATSLQIHTNFMTYEEMNAYFMGYYKALSKPLN